MVQQLLSAKDLKSQTEGMMSTNTGPEKGQVSYSGLKPNQGLQTKAPVATPTPSRPIGASFPGINEPSPTQEVAKVASKSPELKAEATKAFSKPTKAVKIPENIKVVQDTSNIKQVVGELGATVQNNPNITVEDLQGKFPEFNKLEKQVFGELGATIQANPNITVEEIMQKFPELTPEQAKAFEDMNTYEKIVYVPKNDEDKKNLPVWKRVLSVGTPTQETATAMGKTTNELTTLEDNIKGTLYSIGGIGKGGVALLDKLLGTDGMQVLNDYSMQTRGLPIGTLLEQNPEEYKLVLKEIEEGKADQLKTTASQDILNIAEGGLAAAQFVEAPMLFAGITVAGSTDPGSKAMEALTSTFGRIGGVVNMIPGLSNYRDTLPPEDQERFDVFVGNVIGSLLLGTRGKKNIIKDPKTFIAENVGSKQIIDNFKQNVIGLQEGITRPIKQAADYTIDKLNPAIKLDDVAIKEAQKNPYVIDELNAIFDYTEGDMTNTARIKDYQDAAITKVGDEYIQPALDKIIEQYSEGGDMYNKIRETKQPIDVADLEYNAKAIADKYDPSTLTPADERLIASGLRQIDKIVESAKNNNFTVDVALDARRALSDLTKRDEGGQRRQASNTKGDQVIKELRKELDNRLKDQVAGLKETDKLASNKIKEIEDFKKQLIKKDGSINYSNLKNANTLAKTDLAKRLDENVPGATDRIDAIQQAIILAKKTKGVSWVGTMVGKQTMAAIGGLLGSILGPIGASMGAVMGLILEPTIEGIVGGKLSASNRAKLLDTFNELSPEAKLRLVEINNKIENNQDISAADQKLINTAKTKFKNALSTKKSTNATTSDVKPIGNDTNTSNIDQKPKEPIKSGPKGLKPNKPKGLQMKQETAMVKAPDTPKDLQPLYEEARKYKSAEEFVKSQPETPKTIPLRIKSKFSNEGAYKDIPVIRKIEDATLYQGGIGENRQFWTKDKKYAEQFGKVQEKKGTFYQVENGNRVIDVYVEAEPQLKKIREEANK